MESKEEGWTQAEKFVKQKQSTQGAIIMAIASIGVIIIPYFFIISYSWIMTLLLTISGVASLLTAVFSSFIFQVIIFLWFNKTRQYEEDSMIQIEIDQSLSVGVYTFSFLVAMYNIFIAFYLMFHVQISAEFYQAENGQVSELLEDYSYLTYVILPLLFIITLCLAFSAFVSYITITEKDRLRICVLVFALSTTILAFLCYYYSRQAKELAGEHIWFDLFHLIVIFVIALSILAFLFAFLHRSNLFSQFGYALLIVLFLLAGTSFLYFREMQSLRESNKQDCRQLMRNTHQDFILNKASCSKYTREIVCTSENSALFWEKDNSQVCLNQNCCNATAELYLEYHIKSSFGILLLIISCFALVATLLEEAPHDVVFSNKGLEYALALSMVGFIVFGVIILLQAYSTIPQQDMVIVSRQIDVKQNHNPVVFPLGIEGVTYCEAFSVVAKKVLNREFQLDANSRVSILAPKNKIIVTHYYNSPKISYLPVLNGRQLLYPTSKPEDGFLGVQGSFDEVSKFLMEKVEICGVDKSQIQIDIYPLPASGTRMLFHRHDDHTPSSFTAEQVTYINSLHYKDVKARVHDIRTLKAVQDVTLYLFHKEEDCGKFEALPYQIIKLKEEETLLYNLIQKEYFYGAVKQGYYQFCNKMTIDDKHDTFEISLVPRNTKKGQFTVVMETPQQDKFEMILGVTTAECKVGYFNEECGSIHFYGTKYAQAISVDKLAERDYTFFVYFDYTDKDLKKLNRERSQGVAMTTNQINNDDLFDKYNPVVTLYAEETERPIIRYNMPSGMKTQVHSEPNLTWLVLCVDGKIGDISQKSPNTFWSYAQHPTGYQRAESSKDIYPLVCGN